MSAAFGKAGALKACAAAAFLAFVTAAFTWPLPIRLAHAIPHDAGDPLLVTWMLWWSTHVVPLTDRWWNAPAFYPSTGVFAFSETLLGLAPITAPLLWLGQPPLVAYNAAFLASFILSGIAAYLLGFVLTRHHGAALVCGVAFAFNPYRLAHLNHLQLLAAFWMPLSVAALHLYAQGGRARWAIVFAITWLLQALTSGYYFFLFSLLIALWLLWFARQWPAKRLATVGICWFTAAVLMLPLLIGYRRIQDAYGFRRVPSEIAYYSADIAGVASAAPESRVWHRLHAVDKPESQLFPGLTVLVLVGAGFFYKRYAASRESRRLLTFYAGAAAIMWILALGPYPAFESRRLGIAGPYRVLMLLPGFDGIRVPARMWMNAVLCLSAASAIVISQIKSSRVRATVAAASLAGLLLDGWPSTIALASDPGMQITHSTAVARLGLPLAGNETETMYGAIAQQRPVFNGYSGYTAPQHHALADLLNRGDARVFEHLAAGGPIEIIVRNRLDPDGRWRRLAASAPGVGVGDVTPDWIVFEVPAAPAVPVPHVGERLPIARIEASVDGRDIGAVVDGDLASRWHTDGQSGHETIVVDLGRVEQPRALVLSQGVYAAQYPRALDVSISTNRTEWRTVWAGDTALAVYDAAVRAPRRVPLTIPLPGSDARYLRLTQTGADPDRGWSIVELEVAR
jgi:hypothetical protein